MDPKNWLLLCRTVRFGETDAAGVVHFPRLLNWCHQAYEESLERFGLTASEIFPTPDHTPKVALPVVHCQANFLAPLVVGDPLTIQLAPHRLDPGSFELHFSFHKRQQPAARALTRHLAITSASRQRCPLPPAINRWLEASSLSQGIQPL
jgi:1,4-dihydroxy-2-naphthoyl-CoA hydrolase